MSRSYQCLFICESEIFSCFNCLNRRADSNHSDNCSDNDMCFWECSSLDKTIHSTYNLYVKVSDCLL